MPQPAETPSAPSDARGSTIRRGDLVREALRTDRTWWWLIGLAVVGLILRLIWVNYAARTPLGLYDPARYYGIGDNIAHGKGYVELFRLGPNGELLNGQASAYYPPGYPYFVGMIAYGVRIGAIPGSVAMAVGVVQAFLSSISVFFLGILGRRLWSRRAGVLAAGIMAFYPNLIMHSAALLSETLSIFLVLAALVLVVCSPAAPSRARLVQVGLLLGAAVLVRSVVLPLVPMLFIAWWVRGRDVRMALRRTAVVAVALIAVLAPWTVRNAIRMHAFVPIATNNGDNLCIGYEPTASGVYGAGAACRVEHVQMGGTRDEVLHDRETTRVALRYARQDVGRLPGLVLRRARGLFDRDDDAIRAVQSYADPGFIPASRVDHLRLLANGSWLVVSIGGAMGLVLVIWRGRRDSLLVVLSGVSLVIAPLATFADPRFKVPFVPFLCLGLAVLVARLTGSRADLADPADAPRSFLAEAPKT